MRSSAAERLFTPGGCLTANTIRNYLDGSLRWHARSQVDDHLKTCRFCAEALAGLKSRGKSVHVMNDVEYLTRKIRRRYHSSPFSFSRKFPLLVFFSLTIFFILIWAIFYILHQNIMLQKAKDQPKTDTVKTISAPVPELKSE